ncbi:NUDIX domain-containing protein [Bacillus sp. S/N-304-OC-R1]|uniref:NUDIX hydrolase n=1 Tax=Bacillus sp. S/N-304-OC-R1 TaxID=2758034 RepID=UPI0028BECEC3|nr:NUDIX domain-containing protein [Bacillus sp. S/N-304-OC-R1]
MNSIVVGVKAVIVNEEKALIVKRSNNAQIDGGSWEPVGGKLEFGEDLHSALLREVKEEVGLDIEIQKILYASTFKTGPARQVVILTYLCRSKNRDVVLSEEHNDYKWSTKEELKQLLPPSIKTDFLNHQVFDYLV